MTKKSVTEQILGLSSDQRDELEKKELRNTLITTGIGLATMVGSALIERTLNRRLRNEFALKTESEQTQD